MKELNFGAYLHQVIRMRNMTQKEAAERLHISPQTLNNYIQNKRLPDMDTLIHILRVFHLDANRIFQLEKGQDFATLDEDEIRLIRMYRSLDLYHREFVLNMLGQMPRR